MGHPAPHLFWREIREGLCGIIQLVARWPLLENRDPSSGNAATQTTSTTGPSGDRECPGEKCCYPIAAKVLYRYRDVNITPADHISHCAQRHALANILRTGPDEAH